VRLALNGVEASLVGCMHFNSTQMLLVSFPERLAMLPLILIKRRIPKPFSFIYTYALPTLKDKTSFFPTATKSSSLTLSPPTPST